jgi:hypothetical protein
MQTVVYPNQEARFVFLLSDAMNIPAVPTALPRNQIVIDNTGGCCKGLTKRFFQRKETMSAMMGAVLYAMAGIVRQIHQERR